MKVISKVVKNKDFIYKGFVQGSLNDSDVIARSCGYFPGDPLVTANITLENEDYQYQMNLSYETNGEQKLVELTEPEVVARSLGECVGDLEQAYSYARKNKVSEEKDVNILAKLFSQSSEEIFRSNCWFEGLVSLTVVNKKTNESKVLFNQEYESELGIDSVYGSVQDIHDFLKNDQNLIEKLEWLLDY